jgi:hypothetical protein
MPTVGTIRPGAAMTKRDELSRRARVATSFFLTVAAFAGCGGPDFTVATPPSGDDAAASDEVDNAPIIICNPCTDPAADAGDSVGDATVDAAGDARVESGGDAHADNRAEAAAPDAGRAGDASADATPDALVEAAADASPMCSGMMPASCNGSCVDTSIDPNDCGACNATCTADQACVDGTCVCNEASCPNGCCSGGHCVIAETPSACGTGGIACSSCGPGIACTSGICLGCGAPTLITEVSGVAGNGFGSGVAIDGSNMIVGARNSGGSGTAWWYTGSGTTWTLQAPIIEPSGVPAGSSYGSFVALSGSTAMVSASPNGVATDYVFTQQSSAWFPETSIPIPTDTFQVPAFALSGNTAVFGELASASIYTNTGTSWSLQATLQPSDFMPSASTYLLFGAPAAIDGDTILVGAEPYDTTFQPAHWGYVFVRTGTTWSQQGKLIPEGLADNGGPHFNFRVAVQGDTAFLVTSFGVYVFGRSGTTWTQTQMLPPPPNEDSFATSVALDGDKMAVAAASFTGGTSSVYLYGRSHGMWIAGPTVQSTIGPELFASSVAVSGATLAIGGTTSDDPSPLGAVYVYSCSP